MVNTHKNLVKEQVDMTDTTTRVLSVDLSYILEHGIMRLDG